MFKTTRSKIVTLSLAGVIAVSGAGWAITSFAVRDASASATPARVQASAAAETIAQTTTQAQGGLQDPATNPQLRAAILQMLQDRMGLTGAVAENLADQIISRMTNAGLGTNLQSMINWCSNFINSNFAGETGSTNGTAPGWYGGGMMNWAWGNEAPNSSTGSSSSGNSGATDSGFYGPCGVLRGGQAPNSGSNNSGSTSGSSFVPRGMMGYSGIN